MVNLETAVTTRGTPEPKQFHFRAPPASFAAVKAAGLDVVSLANNHTLDYGQVGLADTLAAAANSGVPIVGAGVNADAAYAPWITTVKGVRIAVPGVLPDHRTRLDLGGNRLAARARHGDHRRPDRAGGRGGTCG